jgi:hypothetical protein
MNTQDTNIFWEDIKKTWNAQPESKRINIEVNQLINTFKTKVSDFEKQSIENDLKNITASISDFEKNAIKRDLKFIVDLFQKIKSLFTKK